MIFWAIALYFAYGFQCQPFSRNWSLTDPCRSSFRLDYSASILNAVHDVLLFCLPQPLIWRLQLPFKKKLAVSVTFFIGFVWVSSILMHWASTHMPNLAVSVLPWWEYWRSLTSRAHLDHHTRLISHVSDTIDSEICSQRPDWLYKRHHCTGPHLQRPGTPSSCYLLLPSLDTFILLASPPWRLLTDHFAAPVGALEEITALRITFWAFWPTHRIWAILGSAPWQPKRSQYAEHLYQARH